MAKKNLGTSIYKSRVRHAEYVSTPDGNVIVLSHEVFNDQGNVFRLDESFHLSLCSPRCIAFLHYLFESGFSFEELTRYEGSWELLDIEIKESNGLETLKIANRSFICPSDLADKASNGLFVRKGG